jgi:CDGSH-type Zn-finger protein
MDTDSTGSANAQGDASATVEPTVIVTEHGPHRVLGDVAINQTEATLLRTGGSCPRSRCGGLRNKPLCDATHDVKKFDRAESATTARSPPTATPITPTGSHCSTTAPAPPTAVNAPPAALGERSARDRTSQLRGHAKLEPPRPRAWLACRSFESMNPGRFVIATSKEISDG